MKQVNIYFDMDGVLHFFDEEYRDSEKQKATNRLFKKGTHYFKTTDPNSQMLNVMREIYKNHPVNTFVLSHIINDKRLAVEHIHDKMKWLRKNAGYLSPESILWIPNEDVSKADAIQIMEERRITEADILIDDFNKNLIEWKEAGGTAIKYANGINTAESFETSMSIGKGMNETEIVKLLEDKINLLRHGAVKYPMRRKNEVPLFNYLVKNIMEQDYYLYTEFDEALKQAEAISAKENETVLIYEPVKNRKTGEWHGKNTFTVADGRVEYDKNAENELHMEFYVNAGEWLNPRMEILSASH